MCILEAWVLSKMYLNFSELLVNSFAWEMLPSTNSWKNIYTLTGFKFKFSDESVEKSTLNLQENRIFSS